MHTEILRETWGFEKSRQINSSAIKNGGGRGIRTLDTAFQPYNGLANRRLQPLGHPSVLYIISNG